MAIINERLDAEKIIKSGEVGNRPMKTLHLIGKYYFSLGKNKTQVRDELESFMIKSYKRFNKVKWNDKLDDLINQLGKKKCKMIYVEKIEITKNEIKRIESLPSERLKRMAFAILFRAKLTKEMYGKDDVWLSDSVGYITKIARVYGNSNDKMILLSKLQDFGFIRQSNSMKHFTYQVLFMEDGEDIITIKEPIDDKSIILYYKRLYDETIVECVKCKRLYQQKSNRSKYCEECAREMHNESKLKSWHKNKERYMN